MVFSSVLFLFLFLPAVLTLYHLVRISAAGIEQCRFWPAAGNLILLLSSVLFYMWNEASVFWVLAASVLVDYIAGLILSRGYVPGPIQCLPQGEKRSGIQKSALIGSVACHLSLLGIYKYLNFGAETYNEILGKLSIESLQWHSFGKVLLPLGISFYTFQALSYTIDVYRGRTRATRNLLDFACYVTLFPQLVAGPIVRYRDLSGQLRNRRHDVDSFSYGISRFAEGLAKKVLIANTLSLPADKIFSLPIHEMTMSLAWFGAFCYTLQIYFDFSGYSDMAIGLGRMFGFKYLENFDYPYSSLSIREFWRRWHISLSTWFRDYLYIPLGGSRGSSKRTHCNLFLVFFLCGLWHGANWTFVVWGLYHGVFLIVERAGFDRFLSRLPRPIQMAYTAMIVMGGWVIFRAESLAHAGDILGAMVGRAAGDGLQQHLAFYGTNDVLLALGAGVLFSTPLLPRGMKRLSAMFISHGRRRSLPDAVGIALRIMETIFLIVTSAMWLAAGTHNPFIYFRF